MLVNWPGESVPVPSTVTDTPSRAARPALIRSVAPPVSERALPVPVKAASAEMSSELPAPEAANRAEATVRAVRPGRASRPPPFAAMFDPSTAVRFGST